MGKTAVFTIAILQQLEANKPGEIQAVVLCHTRELAYQVRGAAASTAGTQRCCPPDGRMLAPTAAERAASLRRSATSSSASAST